MKQKIISTTLALCIYFFSAAQLTFGLPKVVLYDKSGNAISTASISDFDNPIIVITYAKSWCSSCVKLIDGLDLNYNSYGASSQVKIVAVNVESGISATSVFDYGRRWKNVEVLNDRDHVFMKAMYTNTAPKIFFLDGNQQVVYTHTTNKLEAKQAFKLASQIRNKEVTANNPHFDKDWFPCPPKESVFYRKVSKKTNGYWQVNDYYKNGKLQMTGEALLVVPLTKQGKYSYYTEAGILESEEYCEKNVREGIYKSYYETGAVKEEIKYSNGKLGGPYLYYHKNGKKAIEGFYKDGEANGAFKYYYDNGKKRKDAVYLNNDLTGKCTGWYQNGKLKFEAHFEYNEILDKPAPLYYHENGNPGVEMIIDSDGTGSLKYLYEDGKPFVVVENINKLFELTHYYSDGKIAAKVTMSDPKTVNGKYIIWHKNGQKSIEATYFKNKPSGKAMSWYENGKTKEKIDYDAGSTEYFDESGNKTSSLKTYSIGVKKGESLNTEYLTNLANYLSILIKEEGTVL